MLDCIHMKEKKLIIGNWKMNPRTVRDARAVFLKIKEAAGKLRNVQTVIAAPFVHLPELTAKVSGHRCVVGAQDVSAEKEGAYTGEVSAMMLSNIGVQYAHLGDRARSLATEALQLGTVPRRNA